MSRINRFARRAGVRALTGTLVGNGPGLLLPFAITAAIGAGTETDVYFYALGLAVFGASVSTMVVESNALPIVRSAMERGLDVRSVAGTVALRAVRGMALIYAAVVVIGGATVWIASGWEGSDVETLIAVSSILSLMVVLVARNSVWAAAAYAQNSFFAPTAAQSLRSLTPLVVLPFVSGSAWWAIALAVSMVAGEGLRAVVLFSAVRLPSPALKGQGHQEADVALWATAGPHAWAVLVGNLIPVVNRLFATAIVAGAVTMIDLGDKVFWVPWLAITSGLVLAQSAQWSSVATVDQEKINGLVRAFWQTMRRAALAGVVGALVTGAGALALVAIAADRETVAGLDVTTFALVLATLGWGLPGAAAAYAGSRFLTSAKATGAMPAVAVASLMSAVLVGWIGGQLLGVVGIALAASASRTVSAGMYVLLCRRASRQLAG